VKPHTTNYQISFYKLLLTLNLLYSNIAVGRPVCHSLVRSMGFVREDNIYRKGVVMDNISFLAPRMDLYEQLRQDDQSVLLATISRAVTCATNGSIIDLQIEVIADALQLTGECNSFYTKQLAQHTALRLAEGYAVLNDIQVRGAPR
jgi:hypothetical protein